jgi:CrcB protein
VTALLVLVGGAFGAVARYLVGVWLQSPRDSAFPWGTFAVNVAGSFVLGATAGAVGAAGGPAWVLVLVGTGFCGSLTTFSTFAFETVRLAEAGALRAAALNVTASLLVGTAACLGGWALATVALG